jgi:glycosyltransferase involved in cell wall biosynthesis
MAKKSTFPISVFIITKNEEERIQIAIKSVINWVDEVIVIDSGSEDKTVDVAKRLGAKVIKHKWEGYGQQKIFGESKCKNDWILNIDSDEEILPELKDEITQIFENNIQDDFYGYRIRIANMFPNEKKPKKWAYSYNQTRLYNKQKAGFRSSSVHDSVIVDGVKEYSAEEKKVIGQLSGRMAHHFITSYTQWIDKLNKVTQMQAQDYFNKGKHACWLKILFIPTIAFCKAFFIRRYFIYGFNGIIYSYVYAFGRCMKYIKARELSGK